MPVISNKSARIYFFGGEFCGPGGSIEVSDEYFKSRNVQAKLASGELVEERDLKQIQAAEEKAAQARQKADGDVQKAQEQVAQKHEQAAQKHEQAAQKQQPR